MPDKIKFSVLIPVYAKDRPLDFKYALNSIWADQVRKPDEVVIVVDGPVSKNIESEIELFCNCCPVVKVHYIKSNKGLAAALNIGLGICKYPYIARMDADDISLPNRFKIQKEFLTNNPDIVILGGAIEEFEDDGIGKYIRKYPLRTKDIKSSISKASPFAHPTVIIKKDILELFKYKENLHSNKKTIVSGNEDIDLWFRIIGQGYEVANTEEVILKYRKAKSFYKRRSIDKAFMEFNIYWNGILSLHGYTLKLVYPILRLVSRLIPNRMVKYLYSSNVRNILT